jgi:hypothetical protein
MNKEISCICAFMLSVMVFSTFTPFAYAATNNTNTAEFSVEKDVSQSCAGDVWFDELSWSEYQKLRNQTVEMIDGWGSKALGEQEQAAEDAGVGTNADVLNSKHVVIPGVNGQAVLLYDVMKNRAVDPDTMCHLNNLFSGGRISYATRLVDQLRYCATDGSEPCDEQLTPEEISTIKGNKEGLLASVVDKLQFWNTAMTDEEQKQLETDAPSSVVESSDAQFTLNSDTNLFFPITRIDFLNFIRSMNWMDRWIATANVLAMVGGAANAAGGLAKLGFKGTLKTAGAGLVERRFIKGVSQGMVDLGKEVKGVNVIKATLKDMEHADFSTAKKMITNEFIDGMDNTYKASLGRIKIFGKEGSMEGKLSSDLSAFSKEGESQAQTLSNKINLIKNEKWADPTITTDLERAKGIARTETPMQAGENMISYETKITENAKNILKEDVANAEDLLNLRSGYSSFDRALTKEGKFTDITDGIRDTNRGVEEWYPVNSKNIWDAVKAQKTYSAKAGLLVTHVLAQKAGGMVGKLLRSTQFMQSVFMGSLWVRNNLLASPYFESSVVSFSLNNELGNLADKNNELHYLDVKKSAGIPELGKFLNGMVDQFLVSAFGVESKSLNSLQQKIKNIQDIVFIEDQDALLTGDASDKAMNVIIPPKDNTNTKLWGFFSSFPKDTLIYNFEHPKGYTPSGISALNLHLSNINIYGVVSEANDQFRTPIDSIIPAVRQFRNAAAFATMIAALPAGASIVVKGGGYVTAVSTIMAVLFGAPVVIESAKTGFGEMMDATKIDRNNLCTNKFNEDDKKKIGFMRGMRVVTSSVSAATSMAPGTPAMLVGLAADLVQLGVSYFESNEIDRITESLQTCLDTEFEGLSYKYIQSPAELKNTTNDMFTPLRAEAVKIFNLFAPEIGSQFDTLSENMKQQVMHIQVDAKDTPVTSVVGKEVYFLNFKDANIRWFQGGSCNIDFCQRKGDGFACMSQNGYRLFDSDGNLLLDGVPQALSLRVNMDEGYLGITQRVIEVKKKDGEFFSIHPSKVELNDECFKGSVMNLTGRSAAQEAVVGESLGDFESIYTPSGLIWFDGNDVAVQFLEEKTCTNGQTYGNREIFRFNDSYIKVYRDSDGKVEIINSTGQASCDFSLGTEGAVGFTNALIRSGFSQPQVGGAKEADFTDVYHVFIYNLVTANKDEINMYNMEECSVDGTKGFRTKVETDDADQQNQWNTLLAGMCFVDVTGAKNSSITFDDSMVTVVDPTGVTRTYKVLGYDPTCGGGLGGYQVLDENNQQTCLYMEKGPNDQPQFRVDAQAPIPLLWTGGMGGSMMWNPNTGSISIKNEFPFALNPAFSLYGATGLAMMLPTPSPLGTRDTGTQDSINPFNNILAALPWMPDGLELVLFMIAIAGGLLFVRIRFRKDKEP